MKAHHQAYLLLIFFYFIGSTLFAQKPALDLAAFDKWKVAGSGSISNDGTYVLYSIRNQPKGSRTLVLQAVSGNWKVELPGIEDMAVFTNDSRKAVFMKEQDTLCLLTLGSSLVEKIPDVAGYRLFKQGNKELLAIHKTSAANNDLLLRNLATGKLQSYANVSLYVLSEDGKALSIQRSKKENSGMSQTLDWVDLVSGKVLTIWEGNGNAGNFIFGGSRQLAFTVENLVSERNEKAVWFYQSNSARAFQLQPKSDGPSTGLSIDMLSDFSKDGSRLFLKLKHPDLPKAIPGAAKVNVWSYTDPKLQPHQFKDMEPTIFFGPGAAAKNYLAVLDLTKQNLIQIEYENDYAGRLGNEKMDDWVIVQRNQGGGYGESYWNKAAKASWFLVSLLNGQRHPVEGEISNFSPNGQYALGYDGQTNVYSYEISSGIKRNLTESLPVPMAWEGGDKPGDIKSRGFGVVGWLSDSRSIIVYDRYDIWLLDVLGAKPPINMTNGYGRKHKTVFRFLDNITKGNIAKHQQLILIAFNTTTKENGFYKTVFGKTGDPEILKMGPYVYHFPGEGLGSAPLKAKAANLYLVQRESASESPNYFLTKDFKTFKQLSAVYPEREYNWMTSELVNFKTLDGKDEQGALFKPTDFNPAKKYPVIFNYYEQKTNHLNTYHRPEAASNDINIPWFVSRGYLVFTPDIHYTIGEPGQSALNSVAGAAVHLRALPFVDAKKMGIQGHSFGGFETNYIITHTNMFAAALSSAGVSNLISLYNDLWGEGASKQESLEKDQIRIGATLWERPELYFKNSPILLADKIATPVLMVQNKEDGAAPFHHGVELFTALRRLGKRAWMLQYDGQAHSISDKKAQLDYTIRMTQFFDHYLKGEPAPQWMLRGIPARMKGVDDGLTLGPAGATPGPGLLIEETSSNHLQETKVRISYEQFFYYCNSGLLQPRTATPWVLGSAISSAPSSTTS